MTEYDKQPRTGKQGTLQLVEDVVKLNTDEITPVEAVEQIARFRAHELKGFIYKYVRDADLAEEMAQESFARLLKRLKEPGIIDVSGYLFVIAKNAVLDYVRRQGCSPIDKYIDIEALEIKSEQGTPEEILKCKEIELVWKKALKELPVLQQEIFYLKRMEQMKTADIAEKYGLTMRSVQRHLATVFKYLHDRL
jgi:RNA polymerase sigma factor (sigma-70 family)